MQVQHVARTGTLVQVIDILRHYADSEAFLLQRGQRFMGGVGLRAADLITALVIERQHPLWVLPPPLRRGDLFHRVILPEAIAGAEGLNAALRADSRAGKYHQVRG